MSDAGVPRAGPYLAHRLRRRRALGGRPLWEWLAPLVLLGVGLTILEWVTGTFHIPRYIVPAPSQVIAALWDDIVSGSLFIHTRVTLVEIVAGFAIGTLSAFIAGVAISQWRPVEATVYPYLVALTTMPKLAIAPLFIVWFGFGMGSKVAVAAMASFFPVLINTVVGLRLTSPDLLDLMVSLRATRWQMLWMVKLPNAVPVIFAGVEVAIVLSVLGGVVAEFLGASAGLGYLLVFRTQRLDTPGVFAVLIILGALGNALNWTVRLLRRRLAFWIEGEGSDRRSVTRGATQLTDARSSMQQGGSSSEHTG